MCLKLNKPESFVSRNPWMDPIFLILPWLITISLILLEARYFKLVSLQKPRWYNVNLPSLLKSKVLVEGTKWMLHVFSLIIVNSDVVHLYWTSCINADKMYRDKGLGASSLVVIALSHALSLFVGVHIDTVTEEYHPGQLDHLWLKMG